MGVAGVMPSSFVSEAIFILFGATSQGLYQVQMRFMSNLSTHTASRLSFSAHSLYLNTADLLRDADGFSLRPTTDHLPKAGGSRMSVGGGAGRHHTGALHPQMLHTPPAAVGARKQPLTRRQRDGGAGPIKARRGPA